MERLLLPQSNKAVKLLLIIKLFPSENALLSIKGKNYSFKLFRVVMIRNRHPHHYDASVLHHSKTCKVAVLHEILIEENKLVCMINFT